MTRLVLRSLSVGYRRKRHHDRVLARELDIELPVGQLTCLLGPNGVGKSTLLRTLAGLHSPLSGAVTLDEQPLHSLSPKTIARHLAVVLTDFFSVGTLPVWSLVATGRYPYTDRAGRLTIEDQTIVHNALSAVGIEHLATRPSNELSDGERQKAMIARALAQQPRVLILDEATAHLDLPHRVELMQLLHNQAKLRNCAILLSSHDLDLCLHHADRLWLLSSTGTIIDGVPEDLLLQGSIERTFANPGLKFDPWHGVFVHPQPPQRTVTLEGSGLVAHWTKRALQRNGFAVVVEPSEWIVRVETNNSNAPSWVLNGEVTLSGYGIEHLLLALNNNFRCPITESSARCKMEERPT